MPSKTVMEMLGLNEDIDPKLAAICGQRLTDMGQGQHVKLLRYCNDVAELHSYLRDRVFGKDAPTQAFVRQCQAELQQAAVPAAPVSAPA